MRIGYTVFSISFLLSSCSQTQKKVEEIQILKHADSTIIVPKIIKEESADTPITLSENIINSTPFFKDYIESIMIDTEIVYQTKKIIVNHTPITRGYILPLKYILDEETKEKKPFVSYTQTQISIADSKLFVNNDQINKHLDSGNAQVKKYGVLLLNKSGIGIIKDSLKLSYSYSIPYTDLGTSVDVLISLSTGEKSIRVE